MRAFTLFISTLLAGYTAAQSLAGLPTCADNCVLQGLPSNCNLDPKCICSSASFISAISCCVSKACDPADQNATLAYAHTICDPVGVALPAEANCANATSNSTTTITSGSSTGTSTIVNSASSSTAPSTASGASASTTGGSQSTGAASTTAGASATSATAAATKTGAANVLMVQGAGLMGVVMLGAAGLL